MQFIFTDKKRMFEEDHSVTFYNWKKKKLQMCQATHGWQLSNIVCFCIGFVSSWVLLGFVSVGVGVYMSGLLFGFGSLFRLRVKGCWLG